MLEVRGTTLALTASLPEVLTAELSVTSSTSSGARLKPPTCTSSGSRTAAAAGLTCLSSAETFRPETEMSGTDTVHEGVAAPADGVAAAAALGVVSLAGGGEAAAPSF